MSLRSDLPWQLVKPQLIAKAEVSLEADKAGSDAAISLKPFLKLLRPIEAGLAMTESNFNYEATLSFVNIVQMAKPQNSDLTLRERVSILD